MRNLCLSDYKARRFVNIDNCEVFCNDRQCFYAYDKGFVISKTENKEEVIWKLTENIYPVLESGDIPKALDITYSCEKDLLYLILYNGLILSIPLTGNDDEDIVGSVESGIKAAQWSPEQEVVALVTGNDTVIVLTKNFDPVSEVELHGGGFGEKQFITVGWGKKETQFRGSEGKFIAKNEKNNEEMLVDGSNKIKITWRGDAEFFAVSSINPENSQRYLRIFNKSGILQYTSENVSGLELPLDWRPSGNLIASTQKLPNKYNICFFEKNGLKHGEFGLTFSHDKIQVEEVLWNKDSKILAVLITKLPEKPENSIVNQNKYLHLYTVNNYHWYCKYTINFTEGTIPISIQWDNLKYNTLHIISKCGHCVYINKYSWLWVTNKSKGDSIADESFVAVIDGCDLKITSFKRGIIPPPMSTYTLQLPAPINLVSFACDDDELSSNDLLVQLSDNSIHLYKFHAQNAMKSITHEKIGMINKFEGFEMSYNVHWVASRMIVMCNVKMEEVESKPFLSMVNFDKLDSVINPQRKDIELESTVAILKPTKTGVVIHNNNGQLYFMDKNTSTLSVLCDTDKRTLIEVEIGAKDDGNFNVLSLDNLNKFYVNEKLVFNGILSFHVHGKFVLLTNMKHQLICVNFETEIPNSNDLSEIFTRRVERGSRLVTSVHKDMKVILQMPRGNLECVQPRALSLYVLGKHIDSLEYYAAFDLMRKQRVNLNLLYDHNPNSFSKNLNVFMEQIKDPQWISLFISELSDEDVTKTMYSVLYKQKPKNNDEYGTSKVDTICGLIEKALIPKKNTEKNLLPILTCYIKRGKTEYLEMALSELKNLKEKELRGIKNSVTFDEAFRYVSYLIDVEELYKIALGMYDFDLVLIVASKSQKDPKEYLPFLNELRKLKPFYQRYTIDKHLKRYKKALTNLVLCNDDDVFNEFINFVKAHQLYKFALKLIPHNTDRYKTLCSCYGEELMKSHMYEEAGIVYSNAGIFKTAIEAFRKSGNWQEVISCAKESKLNEDELHELYLNLAMDLRDAKQYKQSAMVYLDCMNNVNECVRTLSIGKLFADAYWICHLHNRSDLINAIIIPIIMEEGDFMKIQIGNLSDTFTKQKTRLQVVRKQKLEAAESKEEFDNDNDAYSETSTIITQSAASRTTNKTYRSAKNKRKHERKLFSLKEGSPFEDLALITSLHNIVTQCADLRMEVYELNKFLVKIRKNELAEKLQNELDELLKLMETSKSDIWTPDLLQGNQNYGPDSTSNEIAAIFTKSDNSPPNLLNPKFAIPPEISTNVKWQLEILKP